ERYGPPSIDQRPLQPHSRPMPDLAILAAISPGLPPATDPAEPSDAAGSPAWPKAPAPAIRRSWWISVLPNASTDPGSRSRRCDVHTPSGAGEKSRHVATAKFVLFAPTEARHMD